MKTIKEFQQKYIRNYDDKLIDALHKEIYHLQQELTDYKERNERAIEYIKSYDPVLEDLAEYDYHLLEILHKKEGK